MSGDEGRTFCIPVEPGYSIEASTTTRNDGKLLSTPIGQFDVSQIKHASLDGASIALPAVKVVETEPDGQAQPKPRRRKPIEAAAWRTRRKYAIRNKRNKARRGST